MIKRILVGLSGTSYTPVAVRHAIELAQRHDAELMGVTVVDLARLEDVGPVPLGAGHYAQELREHRVRVAREQVQKALDEFATACHAAGVRHSTDHEEAEPFSLMIDLARYYDLMIFGLRALFEEDVVANPQEAIVQLVSAGVRPILAVGPEFRDIRRVLIAYSGSMESAKTLKRFTEFCLWPDMQLRIVHFSETGENGSKLVSDAAAYCRAHGFEPEEDCVTNSPKDHLLPYAAEWNADLIVLGNSHRRLIVRRVFGETAFNVISQSDRPIFMCQ
jgi:nucleotide-binding universal stress UspA family protein